MVVVFFKEGVQHIHVNVDFGVAQNLDFAIFVVSNSRKHPISIDEIRFSIAVSTPRSRIKSTYLKMDLLGRSTNNHRKWRNWRSESQQRCDENTCVFAFLNYTTFCLSTYPIFYEVFFASTEKLSNLSFATIPRRCQYIIMLHYAAILYHIIMENVHDKWNDIKVFKESWSGTKYHLQLFHFFVIDFEKIIFSYKKF